MAAAINTNLGTLLINTYASNPVQNASGLDKGVQIQDLATCAIPAAATDLAGSLYKFCQVRSNEIPIFVEFSSTALTAGALSIGLYETNSSTVAESVTANKQLFATSVNCAAAVAQVNERFTNLALTTFGQRVWQLLGLAADNGKTYDLVATSTTAATVAGTLAMRYSYTV